MGDEDARTIWCGNLHDKITEDILYELFLQAGPVQKVSIPKDRDGKLKSFGFVTYKQACSVPYALDLFSDTVIFNRPLNLKSRNNTVQRMEIARDNYHVEMPQMQQPNAYDNRQYNIPNQLQLGHQMLLGNICSLAYGSSNMFMMPGSGYPSQTAAYSQNPQKTSDYKRSGSRHQGNRNHPYNEREQFNDRQQHNNRQDSYKRDHKSYKDSSHRSNRHDNRRRHR